MTTGLGGNQPDKWRRNDVNVSDLYEVERSVDRLRGMLTWVIILLIVNVIATLYVADFVHQIVTAVHSL
jgi:hypothetical protein